MLFLCFHNNHAYTWKCSTLFLLKKSQFFLLDFQIIFSVGRGNAPRPLLEFMALRLQCSQPLAIFLFSFTNSYFFTTTLHFSYFCFWKFGTSGQNLGRINFWQHWLNFQGYSVKILALYTFVYAFYILCPRYLISHQWLSNLDIYLYGDRGQNLGHVHFW